MKIINMQELTTAQKTQAAQVLTQSLPLGWATQADAEQEIIKRLIPENTLLAALEKGEILGWGGILPLYSGNVMELHPLAVKKEARGKGVGKAIVMALEQAAREKGAYTMWLGADDEQEPPETSFGGVDLFKDFPEKLKSFAPGTHQAGFYAKLGYQVMGVLPDANGPGKPDIFMAKSLR